MSLFHIFKKSKCDITAFLNPTRVLNSRFDPASISNLVKANLFFTILFLPVLSYGQNEGEFAILSSTEVCGTNLGSIDVTIVGDPDSYTWYWEHGATDLDLNDLAAGTYTFVITNMYGCTKTYEKTISSVTSCSFTYSIIDDPVRKCVATIQIIVTSNGIPLDESAINIVWADGNTSGLIREITRFEEATYEVTITLINDDGYCCYIHEFINVTQDEGCDEEEDIKKCDIVVNEFYRNKFGKGQFVELLVHCSGECGDTVDLRGYVIDDNNGELILANNFVNAFNVASIGIDIGFLEFGYVDSWAAVPVGSIILIHNEIRDDGYETTFPDEDPDDNDGDGLYVVSADNTDFLTARSGIWNNTEKKMEYDGYLIPPTWNLLKLSSGADGFQVRNPDKTLNHGISMGQTPYSATNTFSLWISENNTNSCNCRFVGMDYSLPTDYLCNDAEANTKSPGVANSESNQALIDTLRGCIGGGSFQPFIANLNGSIEKESLKVYPNPFEDILNLEFISQKDGDAKITIFTISGQKMSENILYVIKGENTFQILPKNQLPDGLFIIEFIFPSGEKSYKQIIKLNTYWNQD